MRNQSNTFANAVASIHFQNTMNLHEKVICGIMYDNDWGQSWKITFQDKEGFENWLQGGGKLSGVEKFAINLNLASESLIYQALEVKAALIENKLPITEAAARIIYPAIFFFDFKGLIELFRERKGKRLSDHELAEIAIGAANSTTKLNFNQLAGLRFRVLEILVKRVRKTFLECGLGEINSMRGQKAWRGKEEKKEKVVELIEAELGLRMRMVMRYASTGRPYCILKHKEMHTLRIEGEELVRVEKEYGWKSDCKVILNEGERAFHRSPRFTKFPTLKTYYVRVSFKCPPLSLPVNSAGDPVFYGIEIEVPPLREIDKNESFIFMLGQYLPKH